VSLADSDKVGLDKAIESLEKNSFDRHTSTHLDVRDSKAVDAWIEQTVKDHGRLDGAVNSAGVHKDDRRLVDETDEGFARNMDVNAGGVFYCMRAQLRVISKGGSIVSLSVPMTRLLKHSGPFCRQPDSICHRYKSDTVRPGERGKRNSSYWSCWHGQLRRQ
jgi:NAD(P)-dependent dehydrogenase (short-subunit alcohol dehydrogenase family)